MARPVIEGRIGADADDGSWAAAPCCAQGRAWARERCWVARARKLVCFGHGGQLYFFFVLSLTHENRMRRAGERERSGLARVRSGCSEGRYIGQRRRSRWWPVLPSMATEVIAYVSGHREEIRRGGGEASVLDAQRSTRWYCCRVLGTDHSSNGSLGLAKARVPDVQSATRAASSRSR